jgi:hypothetical protein
VAIAVGIVLLTQNVVVYAVLAFVSLVFAFCSADYKFAAALITLVSFCILNQS